MADELSTTIGNLLYSYQGVAQRWYATRAVFLSELEGRQRGTGEQVYSDRGRATPTNGRGPGRITANGKNVAIPAVTGFRQGTGWLAEAGTVNTPHTLNTAQALVTMARAVHPISISLDAIFASRGNFANTGDLSGAAGVLELEMTEAENAFAKTMNEALHLNGDGLLAAVTAGVTSATITVGTGANFNYFYPNRIVDVLTRSNGTPVTNGAGRTIVSTAPASGTITLDLSITVTTSEGVYIEGSYGQALNGIGAAVSPTGTFENIDRSTNPGWVAIDGRGGDTTTAPLDIPMLDGAVRRVGANAEPPDFWIGDLAVVDRFGQGLINQAVYGQGPTGVLQTGWEGYKYRNSFLVGDRDAKPGRLVGADMGAVRLYAYIDGPGWVDGFDIGGRPTPMRFSRKLPAEVWFGDFVQAGWHKLNSWVVMDNLSQAA